MVWQDYTHIRLNSIDYLCIKTRMSGPNVHITLFRRIITYLDFLLLHDINYFKKNHSVVFHNHCHILCHN